MVWGTDELGFCLGGVYLSPVISSKHLSCMIRRMQDLSFVRVETKDGRNVALLIISRVKLLLTCRSWRLCSFDTTGTVVAPDWSEDRKRAPRIRVVRYPGGEVTI